MGVVLVVDVKLSPFGDISNFPFLSTKFYFGQM